MPVIILNQPIFFAIACLSFKAFVLNKLTYTSKMFSTNSSLSKFYVILKLLVYYQLPVYAINEIYSYFLLGKVKINVQRSKIITLAIEPKK